jgi:hypothetical protein
MMPGAHPSLLFGRVSPASSSAQNEGGPGPSLLGTGDEESRFTGRRPGRPITATVPHSLQSHRHERAATNPPLAGRPQPLSRPETQPLLQSAAASPKISPINPAPYVEKRSLSSPDNSPPDFADQFAETRILDSCHSIHTRSQETTSCIWQGCSRSVPYRNECRPSPTLAAIH